jgi:8-oxo-dGTP diphosphatase
MQSDAVQVVVGIVTNNTGEFLLSKRATGIHQGGVWEFPGGKLEAGEDIRHALNRELLEELGLVVNKARPFIRLFYEYPEKTVVLNVWLIQEWEGFPYGKEGQLIQWCSKKNLHEVEFLPANEMIVKALKLPALYLISPGPTDNRMEMFISGIEECIMAGARLLQLRCHENMYIKQSEVITKILSICNAYNAKLLLNTTPATAVSLKAHGVHLNSVRLLQLNQRPLESNYWVAASCHNQIEMAHAEKIGVDFAVLSPVESTISHPNAKPMGWDKFSELSGLANMPVYALGGMLPEDMSKAWNYGAQGIAMLSGVWSSNMPAEVIRKCISV